MAAFKCVSRFRLNSTKFYKNANVYCLVLVLAVFCLMSIWWAFRLPMSSAPDEYMRLQVPLFIAENGCLPRGDDPAIINEVWGTSYAFSVYGSSLIAVPFICVAKLVVPNSSAALIIAARLSNCLLAALNIVCIYLMGKKLKFGNLTSILAATLFAFLPQNVFLAAYFNSEQLEFLSTNLVIILCLNARENRWSYRSCFFLGCGLGVLALSYYYAYGVIIAAIIFYFSSIKKDFCLRTKSDYISAILYRPLVVFSGSFIVCGWFFIRNALLYNGDFIGMATSSKTSEIYGASGFKPSQRGTLRQQGYLPDCLFNQMNYSVYWPLSVAQSFIGTFGYMSIFVGNTSFVLYLLVFIPSLVIGLIRRLFTAKQTGDYLTFIPGLITVATPFLLSIYYSWASDYQPQGRYVMAGFGILSLLCAFGIVSLCQGLWTLLCAEIEVKSCKDESGNSLEKRLAISINDYGVFIKLVKFSVVATVLFYLLLFVRIFIHLIVPLLSSGVL